MKDSYPWCLHGMDKGPFFVLIFSFRQAIALPVLRFCGFERFCKMHEAVYSPMHEAVYGRFHGSMHDVVYGPMHEAVYNRRSKLMHEVVYTHLQKPMHEVVYDFFWAPAAGHDRSSRGEKGILCSRKSAWICLLLRQIVAHGGLYCALFPVISDFIPIEKGRIKTPLKSIYEESVKIRIYRLPTLRPSMPGPSAGTPPPTEERKYILFS